MAVMMVLEIAGVTTDDYARLNEAMGISGDADAPDGLIDHVAAVTSDGELVVVDIWEDEQKLGAFLEGKMRPAADQLGVPEAEPRLAQVHNRLPGTSPEAATLILIELPGASTRLYDDMASAMPAHAADGPGHPGHMHNAATDGSALIVADLWPSEEAFGAFAQEQVGPAAQRVGITSMDQRSLRIHNRIRGREPAAV